MLGNESLQLHPKCISTVCYATLPDAKWFFKIISICMFLTQEATSTPLCELFYPFAHLYVECFLNVVQTLTI